MVTPASLNASCLPATVPEAPRTIAPAWPIRFSLRRITSGDVGRNRLGHPPFDEPGGLLLLFPADLSDHDHRVRSFVFLKEFQNIRKVSQHDRIRAHADNGALPHVILRKNAGEFIRERPASGNDADRPGANMDAGMMPILPLPGTRMPGVVGPRAKTPFSMA